MRVIPLLVLFIYCIEKVHPLRCYSCFTDNEAHCKAVSSIVQCDRTENMCITIESKSTIVTSSKQPAVVETIFQSSCASTRVGCRFYCRLLTRSGEDQCKSSCCTTELCNRYSKHDLKSSISKENSSHMFKESVLVILLSLVSINIVLC